MSDQLNRIEDMLTQLIKIVGNVNSKIDKVDEELQSFRHETATNFERLDRNDKSMKSEMNTYEHSIDILNREQLKIKTDIEKLKNR